MDQTQLITELDSLIEECSPDLPAAASILHYLCAALIANYEDDLAKLVDAWGQQLLEHLEDEESENPS